MTPGRVAALVLLLALVVALAVADTEPTVIDWCDPTTVIGACD